MWRDVTVELLLFYTISNICLRILRKIVQIVGSDCGSLKISEECLWHVHRAGKSSILILRLVIEAGSHCKAYTIKYLKCHTV